MRKTIIIGVALFIMGTLFFSVLKINRTKGNSDNLVIDSQDRKNIFVGDKKYNTTNVITNNEDRSAVSGESKQQQAKELLRLHQKYAESGDFKKASEIYNQAVVMGGRELASDFLAERHEKQVEAVDKAWKNIHQGGLHEQAGRYEEALKYYKAAFAIGEKTMVGFKMIKLYEKLGRFAEALAILDEIVKPTWSEQGKQEANETRSRLLAAIASQNPAK